MLYDSAGKIFRKTGVTAEFRQLDVNQQPAIRARTPNKDSDDTSGAFYRIVSVDAATERHRIKKEAKIPTTSLTARGSGFSIRRATPSTTNRGMPKTSRPHPSLLPCWRN